MSRFTVDLELLSELVERMSGVESRLEAVRDDVGSRMRRLGVVWTGRAALEHQQAYTEWTGGEREVRDALVVLRRVATVAHENYGAAVTANASMWSR